MPKCLNVLHLKLLGILLRAVIVRRHSPPIFSISGNIIDCVDVWPHLGHVFNANLHDDDYILVRRNSLIGQVNDFLLLIF